MSTTHDVIYIDLSTGQQFYSDRVIQSGIVQYRCSQSTPAYVWVLNHNQNSNKFVIKIMNDQGEQISPLSVDIDNLNSLTITFSNPMSGSVILILFDVGIYPI